LNPDKVANSFGVIPGMSVADLGCGAGYFTIIAAKIIGETGKITAVDILEDALESIRAKAVEQNLTNVETVRADLEKEGSSKLANNSQDVVLLVNVLFQSQNKPSIIKEALRIAKPSGRVVIVDWQKGTGGFGPPDDMRTDSDSMRDLASNAGLKLLNVIDAGVFHYGFVFNKPTGS